MYRKHLSWIAAILAFILMMTVAGVGAQESTPIPLIQTLNARMSGAFGGDATPSASVADDFEALIESLPKSRTEDGAFVLGAADAPITLVVFEDFGCPHCQDYHETITAFIRDHVATGEAALETRIFPTAGGQLTAGVSQVLDCAETQQENIFWTAYMGLYDLALAGSYENDAIITLFEDLNIDITAALECAQTVERVTTDVEYGQSLGVAGTPAILVRIGDAEPTFITLNDVTYNRGSVPLDVLAEVVAEANS